MGQEETDTDPVKKATASSSKAYSETASIGKGDSYLTSLANGRQTAMAKSQTASAISTPQNVPTPPNVEPVTRPVETIITNDAPESIKSHLKGLLGTDDVEVYLPKATRNVSPAVMERINTYPVLEWAPALVKGIIATESGGRSDAVGTDVKDSNKGIGLMQLIPATAKQLGLTPEEAADPEKAVPAGIRYLITLHNQTKSALEKQLRDAQGLPIEPDIRMILAGNNGGIGWITKGIRAGYTNWEGMMEYLNASKDPKLAAINTAYPDKVIAAAIPFLKGGNASDDAFINSLKKSGIIEYGK
jgi:hypothetical protein